MGNNPSTSDGDEIRRYHARQRQQQSEEKARLQRLLEEAQKEKYEYMQKVQEMKSIVVETKIQNQQLNSQLYAEKVQKEALMNKPHPCPFAAEGCNIEVKITEMNEHTKICPYRDLTCPLSNFGLCLWKGKISNIYEHFREVHPEHIKANVDKELFIPDITKDRRFLHLVKLELFYFFVHVKLCNQTINMIVQYLGPSTEAKKWSYEFHVYNKNETKRKCTNIGKCIATDDNVDNLYGEYNCAVIPMAYAKTMLNGDKLFYKFYIKKGSNTKTNV